MKRKLGRSPCTSRELMATGSHKNHHRSLQQKGGLSRGEVQSEAAASTLNCSCLAYVMTAVKVPVPWVCEQRVSQLCSPQTFLQHYKKNEPGARDCYLDGSLMRKERPRKGRNIDLAFPFLIQQAPWLCTLLGHCENRT